MRVRLRESSKEGRGLVRLKETGIATIHGEPVMVNFDKTSCQQKQLVHHFDRIATQDMRMDALACLDSRSKEGSDSNYSQ